MRKVTILLLASVLALFSFVSCSTTDHYIPATVDISSQTATLFAQRPDNSNYAVHSEVKDFFDMVDNASSYLAAWQAWESYATSLEGALRSIENTLKDGSAI